MMACSTVSPPAHGRARSRARASARHQGAEARAAAPRRADDARLPVRAFGLNFPNPIGMAAGFDKHAEVPDALLRLGFGFVEIGTVTPQPQSRQSAPAPVPAAAGPGGHQPARLQQRGRRPRRCARLAARANARRHRRRQCRRQQGHRRPHRRLCAPDRDLRAGRELFHRQHLVAQHAAACATCSSRRRSTTCWPRVVEARDARHRARRPDAGAAQDRARPHARRARRRGRRRAPRIASTA